MAAILGNDLTSFSASHIVSQGNLDCLTGGNLPLIDGLTLSSAVYNDLSYPIIANGKSTGNIITLYGDGANQLLMGWDSTSDSANGKHASLFQRSKSNSPSAIWSPWYEIVDSGNFTRFTATQQGEGAQGVWGIDITGNALTASYLLPFPLTGTYGKYEAELPKGSVMVWGESFGDSSLKYSSGGTTYPYTSTGNVGFYLTPDPSSDNLKLNMIINGTYYGNFSGDLNGNATSATRANISTITNTLAYYDNALGHFNYTSYVKYLKHAEVTGAKGYADGLEISGESYRLAADLLDKTNGIIAYGDAGPQIRFSANGGNGAILFSPYGETAGGNAVFHFVEAGGEATIKSQHNVTSGRLTIGANMLNNTYSLYVNGTTGFNSNVRMLSDSVLVYSDSPRQMIQWNTAASSINADTGLDWDGIGVYGSILNLSSKEGINITTKDNVTLQHNGKAVPTTGNDTGTVGNNTKGVYVSGGTILEMSYSLNANVNFSGSSNRMAYYSSTRALSAAAHFVNNSKVAINSTDAPDGNINLLVNGQTQLNNLLSTKGNVAYIGTKATTNMIYFIDNTEDDTGNGIAIGGGGATVIAGGNAIDSFNTTNPTIKTLYLVSDTSIILEGNCQDLSERKGIEITSSGNIVPIKAGAKNNNMQSLGVTDARWASVFIGTANTYGSNTQPIYWDNGVPTPLTFTPNRLYYSVSDVSFSATGHFATSARLAINSTTEPMENFYVNGTSHFSSIITAGASILPEENNKEGSTLGSSGTSGVRWYGLFVGRSDSYGDTEQPIYWNNGVPAATAYSLKATVNDGTANRIAFYSGARAISAGDITSNGKYLGNITNLTVGAAAQEKYKFQVTGDSYLNGNVTHNGITYFANGTTYNINNSAVGYLADLRVDKIRLDDAKIYFYSANNANTSIYGEITADDKYMSFTKSNGNNGFNFNGNIVPLKDKGNSLGTSSFRWNALYIGSADSYGDGYTPIYWLNGVPTVSYPVQYYTWQINNGHTTCTIESTGVLKDNTYVIALVVTGGEANLNGPLTWTTATKTSTLQIKSSAATSGIVSGYVIVARGTAPSASNSSS